MLNITTNQNEGACVITLEGRLDTNTAKSADKEFTEAAASADRFVLDCAGLEYCSSAGLRALKRLNQNAKKKGGPIVMRGVRPEVMDVFDLTGFSALLKFE